MSQAFFDLVYLNDLLTATQGHPDIVIGMIDGPVATSHPALQEADMQHLPTAQTQGVCEVEDSLACVHGTFIAGVLSAHRASDAPGLCPDCRVIVRPIFCEEGADRPACPLVTPTELATAIRETMDAGARIINLSVGSDMAPFETEPSLQAALDTAQQRGVLVVVAAGNQNQLGAVPLFKHPWVIPVVACDANGRMDNSSNLGASIARQGLMAPGVGVTSTAASGDYTTLQGSSMAVPFVTGTLALLWSLHPNVPAGVLRRAILQPTRKRQHLVPPLLHADSSWRTLADWY